MIPQITEINFPSYATLNSATITLSEMGDRNITTQIKIDGDIVPDFSGWELEFKGERFILPVKEPQAAKDNTSRRSIVDLTFSSWAVQEMKRYFFVEMTSIESGTAIADKYKASLGLNIENFVTAFNNVLNYYFNGNIEMDLFGSGTGIYSAEPAFFEIDYTHIWDVLQKIYEIYEVRWTITYDSISEKYIIKVGYPAAEIDDHEFEYGYEGGLLRFERQVQDYDITNVLLGRGGEKNLPYRYFKKVDPQNPNWAGDPDAIPELKNIYFENLRDINFRRYVQGWKTNPNRILEEGDVVETYDSARGETDFAYAKGHTDEKFNPVEYVKDDASIAIYGERWGALDNADDIYPTIQGIEVDPYGRIDQVVDVEDVTTDDIEAMAADAAEITNVAGVSRTEWINANSTLTLDINGTDFIVPEGKVGNLTFVHTWFDTISYGKRGNDQVNIDPSDAVNELVGINTTLSYVTVVNRSTGTEYPPAGIPAGNYFYKLHIVVKSEFEPSMYNSVEVTVGVDGLKLTTSEGNANAWKPTFDIWVKNIWNTTQESGESDEQYAARVWEPILGDRTGEEAKIAFSTGFLSLSEDYNFTIASIPVVDRTKTIDGVASEWRITLIKSDAEYEATGKYIPNAETGGNASAGDYFFFTGIDMPWAYVLWAEEKLNAYKTAELAKLKQINPTWIIRIDKVRANTKEQGELEYLADRFASGAKLRVKDKRFTNGQVLTLYVQTVTYTWQEPSNGNPYLVPDIEVVLSDKVETVASPIDQLEGSVDLIQSTYAKISDIESAIRRVASPIFLKKTGESERSLSPTRFSSLMASESFRQGDIGGQGWGAYTDGEGHSVLEADTIVVRKDMRVNTLTVNQIAYLGGKQIISAAAMECNRVEVVDGGYKCYFDQKQGSVANLFKVDDVVLGQVWNADESELRYYKRKVIAIDSDSITLSSTIADGTGIPQPKDVLVQYGSYSDTSRQYVIVRDVIGGGYERMLSGLTTVFSNGEEYYFAGRQDGSTPRWFVGDANGQHASYQDGVLNITGRLSVTTQVDKGNGTYESLSNYLSNLQDQIDGNIQTWYATGEPTLQNYPANTWPTVEDKNNHIGDLYYESETGKAYRFMLDGNTYKWVQIADEDIAAALALAQQNQTAIAGLAYLKAATNQGTLVQGGLVLTSMIQLGQTEEGAYKVYSGINGIMDTSALGNGIAAWYGGPMADIGADSTLTDFAKSLFRFDGSGYLASGNIKWDLNGNGEIPGISWNNGRITLSPDIYLQGGDRLTQIVDAVNRMYTQFAYDSHDNITVAPTHALYIPTTSPAYPIEGKVALYYDYNGNYSETPGGGGVADIYDLTLRKNGTSLGTYNLGEQAADINIPIGWTDLTEDASHKFVSQSEKDTWSAKQNAISDLTTIRGNANKGATAYSWGDHRAVGYLTEHQSLAGYATQSWVQQQGYLTEHQSLAGYATEQYVGNAISALGLGTASKKDAVSSITSGGAGLPTAGAIYTFVNNAVTAAQPYKGVSSTAITDGGTEMPTISGYTTRTKGDVVAYNKKEFIWEGDKWRELGDEGSYALKTVQVIAGTGLAGGGAISQDVTLSLSSATIASLALADSALQSSDMKALTLKVGSITVASNYNALTARTYTITKANITDTIGSTTYAPYHADGYLPLSAGSTKPLTGDLYFDSNSANKHIYFKYANNGLGSALRMSRGGSLIVGENQRTNGNSTSIYGSDLFVNFGTDAAPYTVVFSGGIVRPFNSTVSLGSSTSRWDDVYASKVYSDVVKVSDILAIPTSAPSSTASGEVYLWASSLGDYAETPSGGGTATVYDLTIRKNGTAIGTYNLGTQAADVNIPVGWSDLTPDASHRFLTDSLISTWNGKQNAISDLATIRSNASHGNTAYGWGDHSQAGYLTSYTETDPIFSASAASGITSGNITSWNGKYTKPSTGIPKTDLASAVQTTLTNADTAYGWGNHANAGYLTSFTETDPTVPSWAKASTKPTYTLDEVADGSTRKLSNYVPTSRTVNGKALSSNITLTLDDIGNGSTRSLANYLPLAGGTMTGAAPINMTYNKVALDFRPDVPSYTTRVLYSNAGNEALMLSAANPVTSIIFKSGYKLVNGTAWNSQFSDSNKPSLQIKAQSVYINDFIANGVTPAYNFKVGGSSCFDGNVVFDASTTDLSIYYKASDAVGYIGMMFGTYGDLYIGYKGPAHSKNLYLDGFNEYLRFGSTKQYSVNLNSTGTVELSGISAVLPTTTNEVNLGSSAKAFNNIYGKLDLSYVQSASDLKAIEALTGTGLAKRTADNTWELTDTADKAGELVTSTEEDAMFTYRQVPSEAVGDVLKATVVKGKSVVWNQIFDNDTPIAYSYNNSGSSAVAARLVVRAKTARIANHKYYAFANFVGDRSGIESSFMGYLTGTVIDVTSQAAIITAGSTSTSTLIELDVRIKAGASVSGTFQPILIDLTKMFGAGNEPATVEEFEALYPLPYYDYNAGELVNNAASGIEMLDAGGNSLGTIPLNITGLTSNGVQIFPVGMKSAGTAYDEWSGTTVIKRIGVVDLGTLTYTRSSSGLFVVTYFAVNFNAKPNPSSYAPSNLLLPGYRAVGGSPINGNDPEKEVALHTSEGGTLYINTAGQFTDISAFKAAMSGVYLYYELATPVTYTTDQPLPDTLAEIESGGTMRRLPVDTTSEVIAPMVCDFQYGANMSDVAKAYLPLSGGTVTGTLEAAGELIIPDSAPRNPDSTKVYLYCDTTGNYYQS